MNKTAIKNFAIAARLTLIDAVTQRAFEYEITENGKNNPDQAEVNGKALTPTELSQRRQLIDRIHQNGFAQTMEEAAYTWFNRFIALRFMEVNGYLPSRVRVFTDENGVFKPEILSEASRVELTAIVKENGVEHEKKYTDHDYILDLLDAQQNDTLYKYLLIAQCNALNCGLPEMFEEIGGWTELLFPNNLLRNDSVIAHMVEDIPEEDWRDQVQIIGWLYQYYNTEPKDKVFADLKKNIKISAEAIPAATQLFTPDWIVRYMVENSLGRLWTEGHGKPGNADWKYYLEEAEQEDSVKAELEKLRAEYKNIQPEQIKVIDPCMGSGHILVYAFDVLMDIYTSCGWSERDAALSILQHNLFGLDIDRRAYQLAYFAVMMKARQYNRSIIKNGEVKPNLANFADVMGVETSLVSGKIREFAEQFKFADTYGSLMEIKAPDGLDEAVSEFNVSFGISKKQLDMMLRIYKNLSQKYDVVVTNPPYMGSSGMNAKLSDFVKNNFADYKSDLFSAFVVKCTQLAKSTGYTGFLTPYVWMFIQSYEKLRGYIYSSKTIETLIQFEYSAFEEATVPICTFVLKNSHVNKNGCYFRLTDFRGGMEVQRQKTLEAIADHKCGFYYESNSENFSKIPGMPVAYWVSEKILNAYVNYPALGKIAAPRKGNSTSDNNRFLRLWHEVDNQKMNLHSTSINKEESREKRWYPYNKGGGYRKWYGFNEYLVDWYDDAAEIRKIKTAVIANYQYFMKPGLTWSTLTSGSFSIRWFNEGYIFDNGGCCIFELGDKREYLCALLNSKVFSYIFGQLNPTLNFQSGEVAKFPIIYEDSQEIKQIVSENVTMSKEEYNCFETSWDFERHPLI